MVEVDHHCRVPNHGRNLLGQNLDLLLHPAPSGSYSHLSAAASLCNVEFSRRHHFGLPHRFGAPVQAAESGV